jgi:hypothetical protein
MCKHLSLPLLPAYDTEKSTERFFKETKKMEKEL